MRTDTFPMTDATPAPEPASLPGEHGVRVERLPAVDAILDALPVEFCVACHGSLRLAIGPSGMFVLSTPPAHGPAEPRAVEVIRVAADTRSALADHLSWVPFVDALLVTERGRQQPVGSPSLASVPIDLLRVTLVEGRTVVTAKLLSSVRQLLRDDQFQPWAFCLPGSTTIDLSDSARSVTAPG